MRPKPTPKKDRRTVRQRLDAAEAAETADWVHDLKRRKPAEKKDDKPASPRPRP